MIGAESHSALLNLAIDIAAGLILLGLLLSFARLILGPTLPDRVVSLDLITIMAVALAGLYALASDESAIIDVAIALALVAFLSTVAFAWYADRRTEQRKFFGRGGRPDGEC